jgi:DNA topoisomerase-2
VEKLAKMGVMDIACALSEIKDTKVAKRTDGSKTKSVRGIPKLTDANWAGTDKSKDCLLLFCEGDSAKAGILSGLTSEDRNCIGVYPLKGKLLNVRGEPTKKIAENKEIAEIKKILGLETGKKYKTAEDVHRHLRYGKAVFLTDQDLDGSHIKGLCINLFHSEWPELSMVPGFIEFMNTPIVKARKGATEVLEFYNNGEYNEWKNSVSQSGSVSQGGGWKIKYYKGLGTSTGKEFREYFEKKKLVAFHHTEKSDDAIDLIFNKKRADERKEWLRKYNRDSYLDTNRRTVSYEEFIDEEFIHFSKYDCDRSIPNLMDGLKISLRKILFSAFKKNLTTEIKVAQFSGYVSEHSGYHHGEASLNAAIVGMAQNFVGSNNIHLFLPNGQFGSRLQGGKDSASERYIYTQLNKITRTLFPAADDPVLQYLTDDGLSVEPLYYAPILPMILINGSKGIGTGFSTEILCYHPLQLMEYIRNKLQGQGQDQDQEDSNRFLPYYEGFRGTVRALEDGKFLLKGVYEKVGEDVIRVTELPVGLWTDNFKEMLENYIDPGLDKEGKRIAPLVKDYRDMSNEVQVDFTITFVRGKLAELEQTGCEHGCNGVEKALKLFTTHGTSNMHLFDAQDVLQKYHKVTDIIDVFYETRLQLYETRKNHIVRTLEQELVLLSNKTRYIQENVQGTLDLRKKKKEEICALLKAKGYVPWEGDEDYKYLVKMPMDSVTEENVAKLMSDYASKQAQLATIRATSERQMWLNELAEFAKVYADYRAERTTTLEVSVPSKKKSTSKKSGK